MMALTHMTISLAGVSFALGTANPAILALAAIGSQLPDLDSTQSWIGQIGYPLARFLEARYPHRTLTHSFLATVTIALLGVPLWFWLGWQGWLALWLGHLLAVFSDTFTKQGVQLFYPAPVWCVCGANPNKRLRTGGPGEYWVLAGAVGLLCLNLWLTSNGGLLSQASRSLGLKEGAVRTYNQHAASHQMYAQVEGVWASDRSRADGRYAIVASEGSEFVLQTPQGLAQTGKQIIATKISIDVGPPATTQTQTLVLNDEDVTRRLQAMQPQFPNAAIYLTGELTIDMPEAVQPLNQTFPVLVLTGSTVKLSYCPIATALLQLYDQYGTGTLTVKTVTPDLRN